MMSADVCQLRLDFEVFTLLGVGGSSEIDEGVCLDMFTVTVRREEEGEKKTRSDSVQRPAVRQWF